MTKLNEDAIEKFTIELLQSQGYEHIHAPDIAPEGERPERNSYQDVLLEDRLTEAIARINPAIPNEAQQEALKAVQRIHSPELLTNNETFHQLLTQGINVSYQKEGNQRGDLSGSLVFVPPNETLFKMSDKIGLLLEKVLKNCKQIRALTNLRYTLLLKLENGKLGLEFNDY